VSRGVIFQNDMIGKLRITYHEFMAAICKAKNNESAASQHYLKAASLGGSNSQNEIGTRFSEGKGISIDLVKAVYWYKKAAEQGNMYAQANIGYAFYEGMGVTQSYKLSLSWYEKAAKQGHPESQYNLGLMYADGYGTKIDKEKAIDWLAKSKEYGITQADEVLYKLQNEI
jgi:TPR repeat protein